MPPTATTRRRRANGTGSAPVYEADRNRYRIQVTIGRTPDRRRIRRSLFVDFVSHDRLASSADGRTFTPGTSSTPVADYRSFDGRRIGALGRARWHPTDEPSFGCLEFHVDRVTEPELEGLGRDRLEARDVVGLR